MAQLKDLMVYGDAKFLANAMLDHDPTLNLEAATKHYVDQAVSGSPQGTVTSITLTQGTGISVSNSGTAITTSGTRTIALDQAFGAEFIVGTQTAATGSWTGVTKRAALYDGMQIAYWLPFAGSGNATLNLTLAGGGTTGAVNCYYNGTTRLTTHYGAGNLVHLTYRSSVNIGGSNYTGWWSNANYDTNDGAYYNRYIYSNSYQAGTVGLFPYALVMERAEGTLDSIVTSSSTGTSKARNTNGFRLPRVLYYNATTTAAGGTLGTYSLYEAYTSLIDARYSFNITTSSLTARKPIYLVGAMGNNGLFFLDATQWWTQALPSSNDGKIYIHIGDAYDGYRMILNYDKPIYRYINGMVQQWVPSTNYAASAGSALYDAGLNPQQKISEWYGHSLSVSGHSLTLEDANGDELNSVTLPDTTYSAGTGLTLSGTQFSVTSANVSTMMNLLSAGPSNATRNDYIIAQYAGGGTSTTTYHRRKLSNIFAALNSSDITTALGYTPYNSTNPNGYTSNTGTVTSVGFSAGTGISLSGNTTINTSGTVTITNSGVVGIKIGGNSATAQTGTVIFNAFSGTDGDSAGTIGLVPAPPATTAKQFLTNQGTWGVISASDIPTLGYLPLTGGTLTPPANSGSRAPLVVDCSAMTNTAWTEGIRIKPAANGWTSLMLCGTDNTATQNSSANSWSMHTYQGAFYLSRNGSTTANQQLTCASGLWTMKSDSTSTAAGTLTITSSAANANAHVLLDLLAPSLSAGSSGSYSTAWLRLGVALNTRNSGCLGFHYVGSGSTSNYLGLGLYAVDYVLNIVGTGRVGIKNTAPISELDVTGGISWSSKATSQYNATDDCVEFIFV